MGHVAAPGAIKEELNSAGLAATYDARRGVRAYQRDPTHVHNRDGYNVSISGQYSIGYNHTGQNHTGQNRTGQKHTGKKLVQTNLNNCYKIVYTILIG